MPGGTAPDPTGEHQADRRVRPRRPALVELSAALLIVAGLLGIIGLYAPDPAKPEGLEWAAVITAVLNVAQIVVGLLIRAGRLWIVDVNYVAVLGFLDLVGATGSPLAFTLGLIEIGVLAVLFAYRPWFDGRRADPLR